VIVVRSARKDDLGSLQIKAAKLKHATSGCNKQYATICHTNEHKYCKNEKVSIAAYYTIRSRHQQRYANTSQTPPEALTPT
jgi:hypothetical protein